MHIRLMTKPNKITVCPAKTQVSLGIRPVWSESSLCAQWVAKDPSFLHADSKDSDQTGQMPRLIWVFAGRTCHFVGFVTRWLMCFHIHNLVTVLPAWAERDQHKQFHDSKNQSGHWSGCKSAQTDQVEIFELLAVVSWWDFKNSWLQSPCYFPKCKRMNKVLPGGGGEGGYLFPWSPRKNGLVPLFPKNKILIFYVPCSPKLSVFPCSPYFWAFVPLFP